MVIVEDVPRDPHLTDWLVPKSLILFSFPGATNETLLQKFNSCHKENNQFYEKPQRKENAFIIKHYAGKVKYQVIIREGSDHSE